MATDTKVFAEEQFLRELHWCVEQLNIGLETQNPDSKQAREAQKTLKILCSDKAPIVKKRQAMRNAFGDYRKKMILAEKKSAAKMKKMKITSLSDSSGYKSVFYRKSLGKQFSKSHPMDVSLPRCQESDTVNECENSDSKSEKPEELLGVSWKGDNSDGKTAEDDVSERLQNFTLVKSEGDFKFNFKLSEDNENSVKDNITDHDGVKENQISNDEEASNSSSSFVMEKSDNSFRFNFGGPS